MVFHMDKGKPALPYYKTIIVLFMIGLTAGSLSCSSPTGTTTSNSGGGGDSGTGWTVSVSPAQNSLPNSIPNINFPVLSSTTVIIRVVDSSGIPPATGNIVYLTCSSGAFGFKTSQGITDYSQPISSTSTTLNQGQAVVTFTAGFSGPTTAVINATYQGVVGSATIEITANPTPTT